MRSPSILVLLTLPVLLAAQEGAPEEPELVLPSLILTVEDIGIERLEAGIPGEADLLPPERTAPLPQSSELEIREPDLILAPPTGDAEGVVLAGATFFVEGQVGAGTLHQLSSDIAIYRPPGFKLAATYDMRDGLAGQSAGAGYYRKNAGLEGRLEVGDDRLGLGVEGSFEDQDVGLQGQSDYRSRVLRRTRVSLEGRYTASRDAGLAATLDAGATTVLLTRDAPLVATGYRLSPTLHGDVGLGPFRASLDLSYALTVDTGAPAVASHRFHPRLTLGVELPLHLVAEADVGWHWKVGGGPHLVPFRVEVSGTPVDPLWFRLAGGYRVVDQDRSDAMSQLPLSLPATGLADERGWYGEASVRVTVVAGLILSAGVDFDVSRDVMSLEAAPGAGGLYAVELLDLNRLGAMAGMLWDITPGVTARLEYRRAFLDHRRFDPTDSVLLRADATLASGRVGLGLAGRFDLVEEIGPQIPRLDVTASVRITPNVRAVAEATDLLSPLTGSSRAGRGPYLEDGFGASVRLLVSL